MNRNNKDEDRFPDAMFNENISEDNPDGMSLSGGDDEVRLARIEEYQYEAHRKDGNLRAILGGLNGGLIEIAWMHETALKNSLQSAGGNILESPFQQGIRTHLNIVRQVARFADLDLRLDAAEQQAESAKAQRRTAAAPAGAKYRGGSS